MMTLKNNFTITYSFLSAIFLLSSSVSYAQQFNQVRAFIVPTAQQPSDFPSELQIQEALAAPAPTPVSSFPPLQPPVQVFVNQFSTPDAEKATPQFVVPNMMLHPPVMPESLEMPTGRGLYQQPSFNYPAMPRATYQKNNHFPQQNMPSNPMGTPFPTYRGTNNNRPFNVPSTFSAMPLSNTNGVNPMAMTGWNNLGSRLPLLPKTNKTNRKKAWGNKPNIWPDVYTDFTNRAWHEGIRTPHNLGQMPDGWHFPSLSMPDPVTVSDVATNQFPPIAEEAGHLVDISKWGIFNSK